ncbi:metallophosphoesterase [Zeaxanthinibacter enoshimensis]|uniref:metallophosphoesterase n=1 Tax=Zeaxanthinibacter enoshimensis TaxID=392009 RepID=UPI00356A31E7
MKKHLALILLFLTLTGCATYEAKYADKKTAKDVRTTKELSHTFYLIGDAGLSPMGGMNPALKIFKDKVQKADTNSTAIFLGDNIYPAGLPDPQDSTVAFLRAKNHLDAQLATVKDFKGRVIFIPGNHDWYTEGLIGLKRQEVYVEEHINRKDAFVPENGCPLELVEINEDIVVIALDTEWYLTNWDYRPSINDDCEIKSREKFMQELESLIKKNAGKTIVIAQHHPIFSYGPHGGQFTFNQQFYPSSTRVPLPILGSFVNLFRKTAGASVEDMHNKRYRELRNRIFTLAQFAEKVIITSGHEHALQYIVENNVPQIVSGSGAKKGATNLLNGSKFTTGRMGYATLEVYTDGSSRVRFYGVDESDKEKEEFLFTTGVFQRDTTVNEYKFPDTFPQTVTTSIYTEEEVERSAFFKLIWGERYREYYGTKVTVPTVDIDTLFGGLEPVRKGGGNQSKSLRLRHSSGKEYVMRAMKKSAERYLQAMAFKDQYIIGEFEETYTEGLLEDFYTGAHPYAPFTVPVMSDAIGIYHTNPELYYVPKQPALGDFNGEFGDELYMIEEHVSEGHTELESFGKAKEIKSTYDFLSKLRSDEKYYVDTDMYIRARLFDMVIGDWDRHQDQWRWAEFKYTDKDSIVYRPIPRDRDQVYSIMGDGLLMSITTKIIPPLKLMEGFRDNIRNVRTFNSNPYSLDMALLNGTELDQWLQQVALLREKLTPEVIDRSFREFPEEVSDETVPKIKGILLSRLSKLEKIARDYYKVLNRAPVIIGTDKDDWFEITGMEDHKTRIRAYRIIKGEKKKMFYDKVFDSRLTRELWIYGLDDDDYFEARGESDNRIDIKIVGGNGTDIYDVQNSSGITVYDYKTKEYTFKNVKGVKVVLTDDYETNTYEPLKLNTSFNQLIPTVGFNPDDGVRVGLNNTYSHYGIRQNPFTNRHEINAAFYFATSGFDLKYKGEFANIFGNWNFAVNGHFTSPNYSVNFFGLGNGTENPEDQFGMDYNRVRLRTISLAPALVWRGPLGASLDVRLFYEDIKVENTSDRFVNQFYVENGEELGKSFLGASARYHYENVDSDAFPTLGMMSDLEVGFRASADDFGTNYGYVVPSLALDHRLMADGTLVLAAKWKAHFNIGNGYEFYQGASLGGSDGLRGLRNQRFIGKTAYFQNTDLRLRLRRMKTGILPVSLGMFAGYDYGRVWYPGSTAGKWHNSYGGGIFANGADVFTGRISLFYGGEGPRVSFGIGFGF